MSFSAMLCNIDLYIFNINFFKKYPIIPTGGLGSEILNDKEFIEK